MSPYRWLVAFALATAACSATPAPAPRALAPAAAPAPAPPPIVHVQVLAINDFHGNIEPPSGHDGWVLAPAEDPIARLGTPAANGTVHVPAGGLVYLAAHVAALRKTNPDGTVVVSAGDLTGASPLLSNLFHDEPTVLGMNELGLDVEGIGNHDLDRGVAELDRLAKGGAADGGTPFPGARFQYVAANVLGADGKPIFPPYALLERKGVRLAFIGLTLKGTPSVTVPEAVAGLTFGDEARTANALLPELRAKGVDVPIILVHEGGFQAAFGTYDGCENLEGDILPILDRLDPAFRVVFSSHTHQAYDCTIGGRVVTSAASSGRLITRIDLAVDPARHELVSASAKNVVVSRDVAPDQDEEKLIAAYREKAAPMANRVVGYLAAPFTREPRASHATSCETPLGDLIADSQLEATRGAGAQIALMNPGGVRTDLVPGPDGAVRYAAAFEVQPFGNKLITLSLTGADLTKVLEHQFAGTRPRVLGVSKGFSYRYVQSSTKKGAEIVDAKLNGSPIRPSASYRITVNSFLARGGDGFTTLVTGKDQTVGPVDVDALTAYLARTVSPRAPLALPRSIGRVVGNACE